MKKSIFQRALAALAAAGLALCVAYSALAQQGGTTRYVYDENGRLHVVITPSGESLVYEYDASGNITAVRRLAADALAIFAFSPHAGIYGDQVTFIGSGFGGGVSEVSFNGTTARIVGVTASTVVAEVPQGATTGLVTINTPRGSVTTTEPFTIAGVVLTPTSVVVKFGETALFTAQVLPSTLEQTVIWSVNDAVGGNSNVGTISTDGLYTAPNHEQQSVTVRATSAADPQRFAEAHVQVRNPEDVQTVLSAAVSVSRAAVLQGTALARPVAVQFGLQADSQTPLSTAVSVQFGNASGVTTSLSRNVSVQFGNPSGGNTALSPGVSVQRGDSTGATGISAPVSVQHGHESGINTPTSPGVSVTTGPTIDNVAPRLVARGSTVTLTITGQNLGGATAVRFINTGGAVDTSLVASGLNVSPDGTTLTLTLAVGSSSALGRRVVIVSTPGGDTLRVDVDSNVIEIIAP